VQDHPGQPFTFSHGPSDTTSYLLQRLVVDHILDGQRDRLFIEETCLHVLKRIVENNYSQGGVFPQKKRKISTEAEIVEAIQKLLATRFEQNPSLEQIAAELHYSPFHLCRIFRKHTGLGIRQYLNQLRLRASLEYIAEASMDLTILSLKLGFASHSHFTESFRKTFGTPPSSLKNSSRRERHGLLSKISIA
jgi:AraC-like DNA-binding protein